MAEAIRITAGFGIGSQCTPFEKRGVQMVPTRDHGQIIAWAEKHNAVPAEIKPRVFDGKPTILYFLFGNARGGTEDIHPISWEDFFARFDLLGLSMAWADDSPHFSIVHVEKAALAAESH
jgi:hypothetical protein